MSTRAELRHAPPGRGVATGRRDVPTPSGADRLADCFERYRATGERSVRNEIVEAHLHLVERHVRRMDGRGIPAEDLRQVALLSLVRAVERFDADKGASFATFAHRTIEGELKRALRDRSWAVRPPRRHQEVFLAVRRAEDDTTQALGRAPTVGELARATGESEDLVLEALDAGGARRAGSLDQPTRGGDASLGSMLGDRDPGLVNADVRLVVAHLLESLDDRERRVVVMRFFEDLAQPEIADRLGLSQSYVSRLLRRILRSMRDELARGFEPRPSSPSA